MDRRPFLPVLTRVALAALFVSAWACGSTKPDDLPPVVGPPNISCPAHVSVDSFAMSVVVTFAPPVVTDGTPPVTAACSKPSGAAFPGGETTVICTATDAVGRRAECQFTVRINVIPQLRGTNFLSVGDSITDGETSKPFYNGGDDAYPTVLRKLLQERYKLQTVLMVAAGFGGENSAQLRDRLAAVLASTHPDALLLFEGANDITQENSVENLRANLTEQVRLALGQGVKMVFVSTILPQGPCAEPLTDACKAKNGAAIVPANQAILAVASAEGAVLVDNYSAVLPHVSTMIGEDGLHPTKAGHQKIADTFFEAIKNNFEVPVAMSPRILRRP